MPSLSHLRIAAFCAGIAICAASHAPALAQAEAVREVQALVKGLPRIANTPKDLALAPDLAAKLGFISSIAVDEQAGLTYLLHRGADMDPIVVIDGAGKRVRSWGKGFFKTPHSVRLDPQGNVWTVDSMSSTVLKFSSAGALLLKIEVGEQPDPTKTTGTSDIAFGPDGQLFIADGYGNARILEYDAAGKRVRAWGTHGTGPGQFDVPHALLLDQGALYVADRENGRVQKFDLAGNFIAQWTGLVKPMGLALTKDGALLVAIGYRDSTNKEKPWLAWVAKLDLKASRVTKVLEVGDDAHGMALTGTAILTGGTTGPAAAVHVFPSN